VVCIKNKASLCRYEPSAEEKHLVSILPLDPILDDSLAIGVLATSGAVIRLRQQILINHPVIESVRVGCTTLGANVGSCSSGNG